jgi:hypothetical protein
MALFSEKYGVEIKQYEILDRVPPIFDMKTHLSNILSILPPMNIPYDVKYRISVYLFHYSKNVNLKLLDFIINKKITHILKDFLLTNNAIEYISYVLEQAGYNTIFFENPSEFDPNDNKLRVHIHSHNTLKNNLMILTNSFQTFDHDENFSNILTNKITFHEFEKQNIETLDFRNAIINDVKDLSDYYHYFDYESDYLNFMNKPLCGYESAIHASTCWFCDRCSTKLFCWRKQSNSTTTNLRNFLYLLLNYCLPYGDSNYVIVLIFQNKVISFGYTCYNQGVTLIEVYENGDITIPNYTFNEITNMKQWEIEDLLKYNFEIKNKK